MIDRLASDLDLLSVITLRDARTTITTQKYLTPCDLTSEARLGVRAVHLVWVLMASTFDVNLPQIWQ